MYQVAQTYSDGRGVPRDEAQAAIWFRKAAEKGNQGAQIGLGRLYAQGLGVGRDRDQALFWFRKAAAQEGMAARIAEQLIASLQTDSAPMLSNAPPDARQQAWNTALNNVRAEAKAGNAASQRTLGDFYSIRGFAGSTDDAQQAMAWWRKAADQGDTRAMDKLAVAYLLGKFVPRDAGQSASWTRKAAEKDDPLAELQFSRDYAAGIGVPNDKVQAIFWFRKADAHGGLFHDWAKSSLAGLNRPIQPLTPTPK